MKAPILKRIPSAGMKQPDLRTLNRTFGLVLAGGFGALAFVRYLWDGVLTPWLVVVSVVFLVTALSVPTWLEPLRNVWMRAASFVGAVNSRILLTIVFAGVVMPIGVLLRLMGKRPIDLIGNRAANSYWRRRYPDEFSPARMERQF